MGGLSVRARERGHPSLAIAWLDSWVPLSRGRTERATRYYTMLNARLSPDEWKGPSRPRIRIVIKRADDRRHARFGRHEMVAAVAVAAEPSVLAQLVQSTGDI